jgi:hypothetical protein
MAAVDTLAVQARAGLAAAVHMVAVDTVAAQVPAGLDAAVALAAAGTAVPQAAAALAVVQSEPVFAVALASAGPMDCAGRSSCLDHS